jgi:hypothetical protein
MYRWGPLRTARLRRDVDQTWTRSDQQWARLAYVRRKGGSLELQESQLNGPDQDVIN